MSSAFPAATLPASSTNTTLATMSAAATCRASAPPRSPAPMMTIERTGLLYRCMTRVSFVTGASRGIGFAIAGALLRNGDAVAITATSEERARTAARDLVNAHGAADRVLALACDVREAGSVQSAIAATI